MPVMNVDAALVPFPACGWEALCFLRGLPGLNVLPDGDFRSFRLRGLAGLREEHREAARRAAATHREAILHWLRREALTDSERAAEDTAAERAMWPLERRYTAPCQMREVLAAHGLRVAVRGDDFEVRNTRDIPPDRLPAVVAFLRRNGHLINRFLRAEQERREDGGPRGDAPGGA